MACFGRLVVGCDHGGVNLKTQLLQHFAMEDFGTHTQERVDYAVYASLVTKYVQSHDNACGVLICKSGVGMSIAANKVAGIRAVLCSGNIDVVRLSRQHNDCNIICFGANFIDTDIAAECLEIFINTEFIRGRHLERIKQMEKLMQG